MPAASRSLLDHLPVEERRLVTDFFGAFAHAEYVLKSLGYIRRGREDAQADWDAFANSIKERFHPRTSRNLRDSWVVLTHYPPRKQVLVDGRLGWREAPRPAGLSAAAWGLLLVRRIRNNLFHGAKFILGGAEQFTRDRELVSAALAFLRHAINLARPPLRGSSGYRVA